MAEDKKRTHIEGFKKLNAGTFYRLEEDEDGRRFIRVVRKGSPGNSAPFAFDYETLTFEDFFRREFNEMFSKICPCIVWQKRTDWVGLWVQVQQKDLPEREFLIVRRNVGQILESLAVMSAGDPIKDRLGTEYIFAKPVIMEELHDKFIEFVMSGDYDEYLSTVKEHAMQLRKYCAYKTKGMGSIIRAADRLTDVCLEEKIKKGIDV